ncbi:MAG TPA: hypothetical protein DIW17_00100 [Clostridiales bacterium]|nr:hypothetical protein [Clostridiales bacterium]
MEELDIRDIIHIIRKHFWIIVLTILLFASASGIISVFFLDDVYASSTTLIVSKQNQNSNVNEIQLSDVNLSRNLVDTYSVIIKSNRVLENVVSDLGLNISVNELKSKINVSAEGNTEILRITVEDLIPEQARDIADSTAEVFISEVNKLLNMENVQVIDTARVSQIPIRPTTVRNCIIAAFLGLMVGLGIIFLIEYLDNTIKTQEDAEEFLKLPVIGRIPNFDTKKSKKKSADRSPRLATGAATRAPVTEAYKTLRTNIQFSNVDNNLKVLMVTSTSKDEGKSSTAANLAVSIAQSNKKVLLIDCDLRSSIVHRIFHLLNEKGLTNILVGEAEPSSIVNSGGISNLHIISAGPKPPNPSELLGSTRMQAFLQQAAEIYDMIILDAPPIMPVSDALVLSKYTDGVVYVVGYGDIAREMVIRAKTDLEKVGAKILGSVINDIPLDTLVGYGSYYYYYGSDSDGKGKKSRNKKRRAQHSA